MATIGSCRRAWPNDISATFRTLATPDTDLRPPGKTNDARERERKSQTEDPRVRVQLERANVFIGGDQGFKEAAGRQCAQVDEGVEVRELLREEDRHRRQHKHLPIVVGRVGTDMLSNAAGEVTAFVFFQVAIPAICKGCSHGLLGCWTRIRNKSLHKLSLPCLRVLSVLAFRQVSFSYSTTLFSLLIFRYVFFYGQSPELKKQELAKGFPFIL
ncbi:hypothetical protein MLD38_039777 [Melastoma candidum]|uniref:Uncharacterized protein n=1 Tax=Melastoma candidum TaxID=119954 RepID=A0ACB9L427_9MYRT|nr:hypothetical protein MLD38_039777 [Melastoma candidum]